MLQDRNGSGGKRYRPVESILFLAFRDARRTTESYGTKPGWWGCLVLSWGHMMFDPAIDGCDKTYPKLPGLKHNRVLLQQG